MKKFIMFLEIKHGVKVSVVALLTILGSSFALADNSCFPIDLTLGFIPAKQIPDNVDVVVQPTDSNGDGYYETVLKISFNKKRKQPNYKGSKAAIFKVFYDADPAGLTVNIGDSASNDGGGGDASTQSNDAEVTIGGLLSGPVDAFDDLLVFGRDGTLEARGASVLSQVNNVVKQGETLSLTVANERLNYRNKLLPTVGTIESSWLYALDKQPDSEGYVNNDIYASFNRVIQANMERLGAGVARVDVCVLKEEREVHDSELDDRKFGIKN